MFSSIFYNYRLALIFINSYWKSSFFVTFFCSFCVWGVLKERLKLYNLYIKRQQKSSVSLNKLPDKVFKKKRKSHQIRTMVQFRLIILQFFLCTLLYQIDAHITWIEAKYPLQVSSKLRSFCFYNDDEKKMNFLYDLIRNILLISIYNI